MIYAAFALWLGLLTLAGMAIYKLWIGLLGPRVVNWLLLPGTVVSEMAYIFGCLITGGEVRRARLIDFGDAGDGRTHTEAAAKYKTLGPLVASLMALVACGAAILIVDRLLGGPMLKAFLAQGVLNGSTSLPKTLPTSWDAFWGQAAGQLDLIKRMCETVGRLDWRQWPGPLFVYLAMCLSIRLAPARRNLRATLGAVVVIAGAVALAGLAWKKFGDLINDVWPLLTYVYATVATVLVVTLVTRGLVTLAASLRGRPATRRYTSRAAADE